MTTYFMNMDIEKQSFCFKRFLKKKIYSFYDLIKVVFFGVEPATLTKTLRSLIYKPLHIVSTFNLISLLNKA